jgi:CubicO group peptidase (beta-lactamase class C family)
MMRYTTLTILLLLLPLSGCKIVQITPHGGAIESASGLYDCPASQTCEIEIEHGSTFDETFTAAAIEGKRFVRWKKGPGYLCGGSIEPCAIAASSDMTKKNLELYLVPIFENDHGEGNNLEARLSRIENGLQPGYQIAGEPVSTFNIEERLKELGIPGISIAMVVDGEIEWAKGYGMADVADMRHVDEYTMFLAGSISKPVSTIRALQLVELGALSLDENVNDYLTSWQLPDNQYTQFEKVTLRRIMNHTAGLTIWGFPGYDKGDVVPSVVEVLDGLGNTGPVRVYKEPGESWQYSGGGYTIMQLMITDTENRQFPETMYQNVLSPLGMSESTFENPLPEAFHTIAATGYRVNGNEVEGKWPIYPEMAAAGLWTTPSELINYAIEIQRISQNKVDGILQRETVEEMLTPGLNNSGLGPFIGEHHFGHNGADEGFRASLIAWNEEPTALVIMVNSDNGSIIQEVQLAIAEEYDLPGISPFIEQVIELSQQQLSKYVGTYELQAGQLTIELADRGLEVTSTFIEGSILLFPKSESSFVDGRNGAAYEFDLEEGVVTGITLFGRASGKKSS